jgi:hypothetical protein
MSLTDEDVTQIRELIRDELRAASLPDALTFKTEMALLTTLKLPEHTVYSRNDILTREVLDHIEMVIMVRLIHAISTRRVDKSAVVPVTGIEPVT